MSIRSTAEVFEEHLRLRVKWDLEEDLRRNYVHEVLLMCNFGVLRGHASIRDSARRLGLQLPGARFEFITKQVADEYAFLEWRAESESFRVEDGADSFVIRDGKIIMQTIRYRLIESEDSSEFSH